MKKLMQWFTRIIFVYRWSDDFSETVDIAAPCSSYSEWIETIKYYMGYCDLNCLHIVKVRGLLAFIAYSLMKRRH